MINKIKKNNKEYDETYQLGNQQYETSYKEWRTLQWYIIWMIITRKY
jgi:hypothetical protein